MAYTDKQKADLLEKISNRLIEGESLRKICMDEDMPAKSTVFSWMHESKEFETTIARARDIQADAIFDDMTDLVNRMMEEGIDPNIIKTAIWSKQWQASKLKPKKYGNNISLDHKGEINIVHMDETDRDL